MIYEREFLPDFREADENGKISVRGYLNYFQDMASTFMHNLGKGNDTIPEEYDACWMYTKYHLQVEREADFMAHLKLESWVSKIRVNSIVQQELTVARDGEICARGTLESCPYDKKKKSLTRLSVIDFPEEVLEEGRGPSLGFVRMKRFSREEMEPVYTHVVRYMDLDKTCHMTNLRYVFLFLDVFDSDFYHQNQICDFELFYISQCFEGEKIAFCKKVEDGVIFLAAFHEDDSEAAQARIVTAERTE